MKWRKPKLFRTLIARSSMRFESICCRNWVSTKFSFNLPLFSILRLRSGQLWMSCSRRTFESQLFKRRVSSRKMKASEKWMWTWRRCGSKTVNFSIFPFFHKRKFLPWIFFRPRFCEEVGSSGKNRRWKEKLNSWLLADWLVHRHNKRGSSASHSSIFWWRCNRRVGRNSFEINSQLNANFQKFVAPRWLNLRSGRRQISCEYLRRYFCWETGFRSPSFVWPISSENNMTDFQ